jgi:hypothetical protein
MRDVVVAQLVQRRFGHRYLPPAGEINSHIVVTIAALAVGQLDLQRLADVYALGSTLYHLLAGHASHLSRAVDEAAPTLDGAEASAPAAGEATTRSAERGPAAPPPPLARVCPDAPAELVAIVYKAMATDLDVRYPDASSLAADVRRFLSGQLVAAHRYTRRQRLRRAVRANRTAVVVAAVALAALLAVGGVSLRRIVSERHTAIAESRRAALARTQAELRADELLVARAESLAAEDPTAAIALLKQLPAASAMWPRARMTAVAAYAEGVARGFPSPSRRPPMVFEMSPRGDLLLVAEEGGGAWLLELSELRRRDLFTLGGHPLGCWLDDGAALLLASEPRGALVYTLADDELRPLHLPAPIESLSCSTRGGAALLDRDGAAWRLASATAAPRRVPTGLGPVRELSQSYDGAWLALAGARELVVLDRHDAVAYRVAGHVRRLARSAAGPFAVLLEDRVLQVELTAPAATVTTRAVPSYAAELYFVGAYLLVLQVGNHLRAADPIRDVELPATPMSSSLVGDDALAVGLEDGSLWISSWWGTRVLRSSTGNPLQRVSGQPGTARFAAWSRDSILVWETANISPRRLPAVPGAHTATFLDERTLLLVGEGAHLVDVTAGTIRSDTSYYLSAFDEPILDPDSGDALLQEPVTGKVLLVRRDPGQLLSPWSRPATCAALLGGGAIALGDDRGQLALGQPGQLVPYQLGHPVVGVSRLGARGAIAVDRKSVV